MSSALRRWAVFGLIVVAAVVAAMVGSAAARRPIRPGDCPHPSVPVPRHEPKYTSGPTELVSGLYMQGGPAPPPPCRPEPRGPFAGTITVRTQGGLVAGRQTVKRGHLAHIALAPGTYEVRGRMTHGPELGPVKVAVRSGQRVRQDLFEDVP